jgi:hypothetical protein
MAGLVGLTVGAGQHVAALGARRVSVGDALARAAWSGFMRAAMLIAEQAASMSLPMQPPAPSSTPSFVRI